MSISSPFIRRPVATSLMAAAFLFVGLVCYFQLPVSALPQVDFPTIQVSAGLPGASPETMASNVATPLERQLSLIPGVTQLTSTSTLGQAQVVLQFELSRNIDAAAQDVQAAVTAAGGQLPSNLPSPPNIRKVNPADQPLIVLSLRSDSVPITTVSDYADNIVAQTLSRIDGVGQVNLFAPRKPAVRIQLDPRRVAALGLQLETIRTAIGANTVNAPKGQLTGADRNLTIYANDQALDLETWNNLIVAFKNGAPVRVRDLGQAVRGPENMLGAGYNLPGVANTNPAIKTGPNISMAVIKAPGSNVFATIEKVKKALPSIQANIPSSISLDIIQDKSQTIRASVKDVQITLLITISLVVAVIFLFLRNVRATLIPSAVIPLSLLATSAVMLPAGFSLDNLSLMAMTIAVGFVVDDAIVMVESIWRRIEHGEKPFQAALNGAGEIGFTILTIAISLIAVFTPLMFMGGVVGRLMREFALTLSAAVVLSVCLSLTFTPMLCAKFLKPPEPPRNPIMKGLESGFHSLERGYARWLEVVMRHKIMTMVVFVATMVLSVLLYATAKTGFFPQQDTGFLQGSVITNQDASFARANAKTMEAAQIIAKDPDVDEVGYNVNSNNLSSSLLQIGLRSREQGRRDGPDQIIGRLRPQLARVVGAQIVLQAQQDINIGGRGARAQFQYTLSDADLDELNAWAPRVLEALQKLPQLKDVNSDQQSNASSATLTIDRDAAGRFGISPADIDAAIYNQVGQRQVAQYFTQLNAYHVVLEGLPEMQGTPDLFNSIFLNSPRTGKPVPLSLLVKVDTSKTRQTAISHQGQLPAATLSFNLSPGVPLGEATKAIEQAKAELGAPESLVASFSGTAQAFQESLSTMPVLILAALLSVYIILGVLYESYIHPLTILSTLPSAGVGALLALRLSGQDLNVIGIIAIILLIGIVKKNGIMIVDVALKLEREEGMGPEEAVIQASHQRLRPILMTTACAFLGGVPMILGQGTGSEFRHPLGWAIVGGLIVSQALTLFSTPVVYVYLDRMRRHFGTEDVSLRGAKHRPTAPAAAHEVTIGDG